MTTRMGAVLVSAVMLAASGCGSSSSGGGRSMVWQDDGVPLTAVGTMARFASQGGRDSLEITGTTFDVTVTVTVAATSPLTPQTFICNQTTAGQSVSVGYVDADGGVQLANQSCTVTLTQAGAVGGAPAVGTFEAVFTLQAGGTKNITNGRFTLPVMM
jgi:hypothetical protein